jgi:hypothetical protein
MSSIEENLFDPDAEADSDVSIKEYDIVASPNDFNVSSYFSFIESGAIIIPGFQRNYVWDLRRASKLIESILMGLPIPQIFLYEEGRNRFLVIDGQQRLMTIYYFMKGRFPKRDARSEIRALFNDKGHLDAVDLENDDLFSTFRLAFKSDGAESAYEGLTYSGLGDLKPTFDLRTIRNIMVKQVRPDDDNSSIFELFNRLNTGGVNLSQQEIRMSLFYGSFIQATVRLNEDQEWRVVLGGSPDQRQRDVEVILRMFALASGYETFKKPLSTFINKFCKDMKNNEDRLDVYRAAFTSYARCMSKIDRELYLEPRSKRVSVPILEAVFVASAQDAIRSNRPDMLIHFTDEHLRALKAHSDFDRYFTGKTTDVEAIKGRVDTAKTVIKVQ